MARREAGQRLWCFNRFATTNISNARRLTSAPKKGLCRLLGPAPPPPGGALAAPGALVGWAVAVPPGRAAAGSTRWRRRDRPHRCAHASRYRQPHDSFHRNTSAMASPCDADPAACMKYLRPRANHAMALTTAARRPAHRPAPGASGAPLQLTR